MDNTPIREETQGREKQAITSLEVDPNVLLTRPVSGDWLEERASYLGATDIAAIMGLHPYKTPMLVYQEKNGLIPPPELSQAMAHGQNLELYVAQCYSRITGRELHRSRFWRDRKVPHFGCNPDYEVRVERPLRLVECKTAGYFAGQIFGGAADAVPDQYLVQCMWQLMVTGREVCDLAVLIGGQDFRIYEIRRDEELMGILREKADAWWRDYMLSDSPPPITGERPDCEWVGREYPSDNGQVRYADPDLDDLCIQLRDTRIATQTVAVEESRLENLIKLAMGYAGTLECTIGTITWKTSANGQRRFCPKFKEVSKCQTSQTAA